jgi:hypothetical protein
MGYTMEHALVEPISIWWNNIPSYQAWHIPCEMDPNHWQAICWTHSMLATTLVGLPWKPIANLRILFEKFTNKKFIVHYLFTPYNPFTITPNLIMQKSIQLSIVLYQHETTYCAILNPTKSFWSFKKKVNWQKKSYSLNLTILFLFLFSGKKFQFFLSQNCKNKKSLNIWLQILWHLYSWSPLELIFVVVYMFKTTRWISTTSITI